MTDCILSPKAPRITGYSYVWKDGTMKLAHRAAWEMANGPIPPGMGVCHRCDVRNCVNPDHLFLGTQRENMLDCSAKGRLNNWQARKKQCPRGHPYDRLIGKARKIRRCSVCAAANYRRWYARHMSA